jgi:hypothetical protein
VRTSDGMRLSALRLPFFFVRFVVIANLGRSRAARTIERVPLFDILIGTRGAPGVRAPYSSPPAKEGQRSNPQVAQVRHQLAAKPSHCHSQCFGHCFGVVRRWIVAQRRVHEKTGGMA